MQSTTNQNNKFENQPMKTILKLKDNINDSITLNDRILLANSSTITNNIAHNLYKIEKDLNILLNIANKITFKEMYLNKMQKEGLYYLAITNAEEHEWEELYLNAMNWKYWPNVYHASKSGDLIIDGKDSPFKQLPEEVNKLDNLKQIHLVNCQLEIWPNNLLTNNKNLLYLNLSNNKIDLIPLNFYILPLCNNLLKFNISHNPIREITDLIMFKKLTYFDASFTLLSEFPRYDRNLQVINLVSCLIQGKQALPDILPIEKNEKPRVILFGCIPKNDNRIYWINDSRDSHRHNKVYGFHPIYFRKADEGRIVSPNKIRFYITGLKFEKLFTRYLEELQNGNDPYLTDLIKIMDKEFIKSQIYNTTLNERMENIYSPNYDNKYLGEKRGYELIDAQNKPSPSESENPEKIQKKSFYSEKITDYADDVETEED